MLYNLLIVIFFILSCKFITTAPVFSICLFCWALVFLIGKNTDKSVKTTAIDKLITQHKNVLYMKYKQTHYIDEYGTMCSNGWDREVIYFINHVVKPQIGADINIKNIKFKINSLMHNIQEEENNSGNKKNKTKKQAKKIKTGVDYERYVGEILQQNEYQVKETPTTGDQGVDLIATKNNIRIAIQCKFYSKPVGNKAVQEVATGKEFYDCEYACVVSNNTYTLSAKKLASASNVLLFNESNIVEGLNEIISDYTSDKTKYDDDDENNEDEELLFTDLTDENDPIKIK